jgi:hypothetical protein
MRREGVDPLKMRGGKHPCEDYCLASEALFSMANFSRL